MNNYLSFIFNKYLSLSILLAVLLSILLTSHPVVWWVGGILFLFIIKFADCRTLTLKSLIFYLLAGVSVLYSKHNSTIELSLSKFKDSKIIECVIKVNDNRIINVLDFPPPTMLKAEVLSIGRVQLKTPIKVFLSSKHIKIVKYGGVYYIKGKIINLLKTPPLAFENYLRSNDRAILIYPFYSKFKKIDYGVLNYIYEFRDNLIGKFSTGLSEKAFHLLAGLIFGCKQGVEYSDKQLFYNTGTGHALAISGLHLGMIAFIVMLFLKLTLIPVKYRYNLLPILLFIYVLIVGMPISAIRAYIMFSIWAIFKANYRRVNNLDIFFFTASILIILNPLTIYDIGFHFSFFTVFALLISVKPIQTILKSAFEQELWCLMPQSTYKIIVRKLKYSLLQTTLFSVVAWSSSSLLTIFYFGKIILISPLVNLFLIPILFVIILLSVTHLILTILSLSLLSHIINMLISLLYFSLAIMQSSSSILYFPNLKIFILILMSLFIFLFYFSFLKEYFKWGLICLFIMLFVLYNINLNKGRKEVVVLNSNLIVDYHKRCVERIRNVNSYEDLDRVTQFLFNNGLHQIDLVITNKNDVRFSKILTKRFDVKRVIVPNDNIRKQIEQYLKHWGINNTHILLKE